MTIREDAEELESALNKLDQQARYCVIYAIVYVKFHWVFNVDGSTGHVVFV